MSEIVCKSCGKEQPSKNFAWEKRGYQRKNCNSCRYKQNPFDVHKTLTEKPEVLKCRVCSEEKQYTSQQFYEDEKCRFGLRRECKDCTKRKQREAHYFAKYSMSPEEVAYFKTFCEICNTDLDLCVDHCHITGKVRGCLCRTCNSGLGQFKDNIEYLERAIAYLKEKDYN